MHYDVAGSGKIDQCLARDVGIDRLHCMSGGRKVPEILAGSKGWKGIATKGRINNRASTSKGGKNAFFEV